jgi:AcrR family transcriptional regulator
MKSPVNDSAGPIDARGEEILRAAQAIFAEKGFHGATMLDVARHAHASKATLYARFQSKEALFRALVDWATRQGAKTLDAIADDRTLDPRAALDRFATQLLSLMMQPEKLALLRIAVAEGGRAPSAGKIFSDFTREHGARLGRLIASRLVNQGLIEIGDGEEFGHAFVGLLQGELLTRALLGVIPPPTNAEIQRHARRAMARLLRAFAPRKT